MDTKIRVSPQQRQENISRSQIREFLELHSFVTADISPDLGEDFLVRIFDNGVSTGLSFYLQLKSVEDIGKYRTKSGDISYPLETKDLDHWRAQTNLVIIVIWDITQKRGWWIECNNAIHDLETARPNWEQQQKVNVHIPIKNQFDEVGLVNIRHLLANFHFPSVSKGKELVINAKFKFPTTEEGKVKLIEFQKHIASGDEIELPGNYIEEFDFPSWFKRLYGDFDSSKMHLTITPLSSAIPQIAEIELISEFGQEKLPYIELFVVKGGSEEVTLSNKEADIPIRFELVLNVVKKSIIITIKTIPEKVDFPTLLHILKIQHILSVEGKIILTMLRSGEQITFLRPAGLFPPVDEKFLELINKICRIQKSFNVILKPRQDGSITFDDLEAIDELISVIDNGNYHRNGMMFSTGVRKEFLNQYIGTIQSGGPSEFRITDEESYIDIFSQRIEMGPIFQRIKGHCRTPFDEIKNWMEQANDDDFYTLVLEDVEFYEEFEKWKRDQKP